MALVRLDGAYGDGTVIAQLLLAGMSSVPRWRGYLLLERPQIQRVLAHPPTASVLRINSGELVEVFEGGWLELGEEGLSRVRVIVARHTVNLGIPWLIPRDAQRAVVFKRSGSRRYFKACVLV